MQAMTTPTSPEVEQLQAESASLEKQIERYSQQVAAMSDLASQKRREAQEAYRSKHADTFKDLDVAKALTGAPVKHTFTIGMASYGISAPSGETARQVYSFVMNPITKVKGEEGKLTETDVGPIGQDESFLLRWLVEVGMGEQKRKLENTPIADKLKLIRGLNEVTIGAIAKRCHTLETYLNVCLELDLGNF